MPKRQDAPPNLTDEVYMHRRVLLREAQIAIRASPMTVQWLLTLSDEEIGRHYRTSFNVALSLMFADSRVQKAGLPFTKERLLNAAEIEREFGVSSIAIARDVAASRAFAVELDGIEHYPTFLFDSRIDRKVLAKVIRRLGALEGWSKWHFFVSRRGSLNRATPLAALVRGEVDAVLKAAAAFAER